MLYTGSDDGLVHVSSDSGQNWTDVSANIPNVPAQRWITRVECSPFDENSAFVTIDRHRNDDRALRVQDRGPRQNVEVDRGQPAGERLGARDPRRSAQRDLLFVGTEFGLFVSTDGGRSWQPFGKGLPTVAVHDLVIHPRDRELVIATHGRSIYIVDVAPLEELTAKVRASQAHLFEIKPATLFSYRPGRGLSAGKNYLAPNPPFGATLWYWLKDKSEQEVTLSILGTDGKPVWTGEGPGSQVCTRCSGRCARERGVTPPWWRRASTRCSSRWAARSKRGRSGWRRNESANRSCGVAV